MYFSFWNAICMPKAHLDFGNEFKRINERAYFDG